MHLGCDFQLDYIQYTQLSYIYCTNNNNNNERNEPFGLSFLWFSDHLIIWLPRKDWVNKEWELEGILLDETKWSFKALTILESGDENRLSFIYIQMRNLLSFIYYLVSFCVCRHWMCWCKFHDRFYRGISQPSPPTYSPFSPLFYFVLRYWKYVWFRLSLMVGVFFCILVNRKNGWWIHLILHEKLLLLLLLTLTYSYTYILSQVWKKKWR